MIRPAGYRIRRRRESDDDALVAAENCAAQLFRADGHPEVADPPIPDVASFRRLVADCAIWVCVDASNMPVGFAAAAPVAAGFASQGTFGRSRTW